VGGIRCAVVVVVVVRVEVVMVMVVVARAAVRAAVRAVVRAVARARRVHQDEAGGGREGPPWADGDGEDEREGGA
jgi:hypothetical protein